MRNSTLQPECLFLAEILAYHRVVKRFLIPLVPRNVSQWVLIPLA